MDRFRVTTVQCMRCGKTQGVGPRCEGCGADFARYHCGECRLYEDDPSKDIYHCPHCKLCRVGKGLGIDYFHCHTCSACMHISLQYRHRCVERAMDSDCPVCLKHMFTSTEKVMFLPCGHCMHVDCYSDYTKRDYKCPLCSKSLADMSVYFQRLDEWLAGEVLPPEYEAMRNTVLCNDCERYSETKFHFQYHKCQRCGSYNTKVTATRRLEDAGQNTEQNAEQNAE